MTPTDQCLLLIGWAFLVFALFKVAFKVRYIINEIVYLYRILYNQREHLCLLEQSVLELKNRICFLESPARAANGQFVGRK